MFYKTCFGIYSDSEVERMQSIVRDCVPSNEIANPKFFDFVNTGDKVHAIMLLKNSYPDLDFGIAECKDMVEYFMKEQ